MTEQRTEDYRDVLEELAISRGFSSAEELAEEVVEVDPGYSTRDILEAGHGGFGAPLDKVLGMSEEEKVRLTRSLAEGMRVAETLGICGMPGCRRPVADHTFGCLEHVRLYDAESDLEDWELCLKILRPWVQAAEPIGSDPLTQVMEGALAEAEEMLRRARRELKAAEAAL